MHSIESEHFRAGITTDTVWVREIDASGCGGGVIDALGKPKHIAVAKQLIEDGKSDNLSFSDMWETLNRGCALHFDYRSY